MARLLNRSRALARNLPQALVLPALIVSALLLNTALPTHAQTASPAVLPDDPANGSITGTVVSRDGSVYEGTF